jgi:hypothetical protein
LPVWRDPHVVQASEEAGSHPVAAVRARPRPGRGTARRPRPCRRRNQEGGQVRHV